MSSTIAGIARDWGNACIKALSHPIHTLKEALSSLLNHLTTRYEIDFLAWKERFVTPIPALPQRFLEAVAESNRQNPEGPLALVLLGKEEFNLLPILQIGKTHRLAIKMLHTGHLLRRTLQDAKKEFREPIEMLCIAAPNEDERMILGKREFWNPSPTLEISHLHEKDFGLLAPDASIILDMESDNFDFVDAMRSISQHPVFSLRYAAKGEEAFSQLQQSAGDTDDPNAQYKIGWCFDAGYGVEQSEADAINWYKRAAEKGHIKAQYKLGRIYDSLEQYEEALPWYLAAAEGGHASAQFRVGSFFQLGRGGLSQSFEDAVHWYNRAAEQGQPQAQFWANYYRNQGIFAL